MAKVPDTIEGIEAEIETARAELKVAQDKFNRRFKVLNKKYQALKQAELDTSDLAGLLQTYNAMGSNEIGYKMLKKRYPEYDNDHGLVFSGMGWSETNQYCLTVRMRYGWDETHIQATVKAIEEAIPYVTPGAIKHLPDHKVLNLGFGGELKLVARPDGTWALQSDRSYYKNPSKEGTLEEMLRYILQTMAYGRPEPEDDEED